MIYLKHRFSMISWISIFENVMKENFETNIPYIGEDDQNLQVQDRLQFLISFSHPWPAAEPQPHPWYTWQCRLSTRRWGSTAHYPSPTQGQWDHPCMPVLSEDWRDWAGSWCSSWSHWQHLCWCRRCPEDVDQCYKHNCPLPQIIEIPLSIPENHVFLDKIRYYQISFRGSLKGLKERMMIKRN